jgi:arabinogalactan endo-1,4-beta-galactosidase
VADFLSTYDIISFSHYKYSHVTIIKLFTNALALRTNVANQALQIENANITYGIQGCNV